MESIVIYKSKTGFTKRYAEWIAEEIGCNTMNEKVVTTKSLEPYDTVIYGGGITAGQIGGLKKFKSLMASFPDKRLIVFATGATPPEVFIEKDQIKDTNFNEEEKKKIPYFYCYSGINYENMGLGSKLLMKMFTAMLSKQKNKSSDEQGMADTIKKSCDFSSRNYIVPLIECVRKEIT